MDFPSFIFAPHFHNFIMEQFVSYFLTQNLNYKKETSSMVLKLSFFFSFPINVDHKGTI